MHNLTNRILQGFVSPVWIEKYMILQPAAFNRFTVVIACLVQGIVSTHMCFLKLLHKLLMNTPSQLYQLNNSPLNSSTQTPLVFVPHAHTLQLPQQTGFLSFP